MISRLLQPGGALYLFHQPPSWSQTDAPQAFATVLANTLRDVGFSVKTAAMQDGEAVPTVCVVAETP